MTDLATTAKEMRRKILEMAFYSKTAHIGSALCITDILAVLFFQVMRLRPEDPLWEGRDRFILSKGHGAAALYAALALRGFFPVEDLQTYCKNGGKLHGHPCFGAAPGIETSTGSLGHGLGVAAGMALAEPTKAKRVFVLIGDGECNEGSVWEAAAFVTTHKLNQITVIIDDNQFQGFGATNDVVQMDLAAQWRAAGWDVHVLDGHNVAELTESLQKTTLRPTVFIAKTVAGKGVQYVENTLLAHYFTLTPETFEKIIAELYAK